MPGDVYAQRLQEKAQQVAAERQQTQDERQGRIDARGEQTFANETEDRKALIAQRDAAQVAAQGYQPELVSATVDSWEQRGIVPPEEAAQLREHVKTPEGAKMWIDKIAQIKSPVPKEPEPFTLSPGQTRFNPDGTTQANVPVTPPAPKEEKTYEIVVRGSNGRPVKKVVTESELRGGIEQYQEPKAAPDEGPLVQIAGPNGTPIWVKRADAVGQQAAQAPRAVTGIERGVLAFYNRGKEAVETLTTPEADGKSLEQRMSEQSAPGQVRLKYAPNFAQTDDQQRYRQAQRAFTEARLRKESGAAINDAEYDKDARTYFAQPGDSKVTIEQKKKARATVLEGLKFSAGKAFDEYYGEPNLSPARTDNTDRVRVVGPKGETGTVPKGSKLPTGWKLE